MINLSLKQAETALAKGQLDEAFSLMRDRNARATRPAQIFATKLVDALVGRGKEHLAANRLSAAASDAAKAIELGGQQPMIVELFERVRAAQAAEQRRQRHQQQVLQVAKQQIQEGEESQGARLLADVSLDQTEVKQLSQQIEMGRGIIEAAVKRAQSAVESDDYEHAIEILADIASRYPNHELVRREINQLMATVHQRWMKDLHAGRLDRVCRMSQFAGRLAGRCAAADEIMKWTQRCVDLRQAVDQLDGVEALQHLGLLSQIIPDAPWIGPLQDSLQAIVASVSEIRRGPLGLINDLEAPKNSWRRNDENQDLEDSPRRLLFQIDGVGGIMLLQNDRVVIGGASRGTGIDVAVMTDGVPAPIEVVRDGEDYWLSSEHEIKVNDRKTDRHLLSHGDVIHVGRRGRLRFSKPVAASSSAILEIKGAPLSRNDIRRVVLFADSLLLGGGSGVHIAVKDSSSKYVVHRKKRDLMIGRIGKRSEQQRLALDQSIEIDSVRLRVTEFDSRVSMATARREWS